MLKSEFESLAGRAVTNEQYRAIEILYMSSNLEKAEFVKSMRPMLKNIPQPEKKKDIKRMVVRDHSGFRRRESNERNEKEAVAGNSYDSEKAGQRKPGDHQKQRRDSESQRYSRRTESGVRNRKSEVIRCQKAIFVSPKQTSVLIF